MALLDDNNRRETVSLCNRELLPVYLHFKQAMSEMFEYNSREARSSGNIIITLCTITEWVVAGIVVFIFIVGFLIGLFK